MGYTFQIKDILTAAVLQRIYSLRKCTRISDKESVGDLPQHLQRPIPSCQLAARQHDEVRGVRLHDLEGRADTAFREQSSLGALRGLG